TPPGTIARWVAPSGRVGQHRPCYAQRGGGISGCRTGDSLAPCDRERSVARPAARDLGWAIRRPVPGGRMRVLSPGKLRGMRQIASARGVIAVTAVDHRGSLEAMLKRTMPGRPIGFAARA